MPSTTSTPPSPAALSACPCGSGHGYADCCGRYHSGPLALQAPDAQALMRSRYSAFALGLMEYLLATWHPDTRPADLEPLAPGLKWLGLEVRGGSLVQGADGGVDPDRATVEFVARSKLGGRAHRLHETSRFVREGGRWWYVDGQVR